MSSPTQADIKAMGDQLDTGLSAIEAQLTDLIAGVQYQASSQQLFVCTNIVDSVEQAGADLKGTAQGLMDQVQQLVAAVGQMADQTAANVATNMGDAGLPSPIAAVTSDLVQDYSACATTATPDTTSTTTTCPPVEVHVTCEPCDTDTATTTPPSDTTPPPDTGPPLPPPTEPPPPEPPPPVEEAVCATWKQCPPDDVTWMGAAGHPDSWFLSDTSQPYQDQLFAAMPGADVAELFAGMSSVGDLVQFQGAWLADQLQNEYVGDTSPESQISKQLEG